MKFLLRQNTIGSLWCLLNPQKLIENFKKMQKNLVMSKKSSNFAGFFA